MASLSSQHLHYSELLSQERFPNNVFKTCMSETPKPTFVVFSMVFLCFLRFFPIRLAMCSPCFPHVFFPMAIDDLIRIPVREITEVDEYSREAKDDVTFRSLGPGFKPWTEKKNWLVVWNIFVFPNIGNNHPYE